VQQLAEHSLSGRLHGQDAIHTPGRSREKDPEALLTLPEFIREAMPSQLVRDDPNAMMTLPEFVREVQPPALPSPSLAPPPIKSSSSIGTLSRIRSGKKSNRERSMSAPSLSWLRSHSRSRSRGATPDATSHSTSGTSTPKGLLF
jgi:ubiquitin-protein ligase E3 D